MAVARQRSRGRDPPPAGALRGGFTLAEVLAAALVLAVGVLALQALGVVAARATATAGNSARVLSSATRQMEDAHRELARGALPASLSCVLPTGDRLSRRVTVLDPGTLSLVEVEIVPAEGGPAASPVALRTHVYSPTGFDSPPVPASCP